MSDQERLSDDRLAELRQDWREGLPIHEDDLGALLTEIEQRRAADRERETQSRSLETGHG